MKKYILSLTVLTLIISLLSVGAMAIDYKEAPSLEDEVQAGQLPAVEERVPEDPFVVGPGVLIAEEDLDWQSGQYGGILDTTHSNPNWNPDVFVMCNEALLISPGLSTNQIQGNVLKDYEVNEDNTEFTFYMREGLKWSDGVPVTTEDIRFTYEDVLMNEKITPVFPAKYRAGGRAEGEPMDLEVIDDYTFKVSFEEPYGSFLSMITISGWVGYTELLKPAHYLKDYHTKYTPIEDMKEDLEEEQLGDAWWDLFTARDVLNWDLTREKAIGFPVLYPWMRVEGPSGVMVMKRNPYYFKVDEEGHQLPYIEEIRSMEVNDTEMATMKVLTGECEYLREDTALNKMPLYKQNEDRGNYDVYPLKMHVDPTIFMLNLAFEDDTWQSVVQDKRFRQAVTHAIDRSEIIESVYYGMASMPETIPSEYDPEKARSLLNEMGMDKKDEQGYRLAPNGERFEIFAEVQDAAPDIIPTTEIIMSYLRDVGINASMKQISSELSGQKNEANQLMAHTIWLHQPLWRDGLMGDYLPTVWAPGWNAWYLGSEEGVEPPEGAKKVFDIHEDIMAAAPGTPEFEAATDALYDWFYDYIPIFTPAEEVIYPMIASKDLANVPTSGFAIAANFAGEQMFFKSE